MKTVNVKLDGSSAITRGPGYHNGGVGVWPHAICGVLGASNLLQIIQEAEDRGALLFVGNSIGLSLRATDRDGAAWVVSLVADREFPLVGYQQIRKDGQLGCEFRVCQFDASGWPERVTRTELVLDKRAGAARANYVTTHLRVKFVGGAVVTGAQVLEDAEDCRLMCYGAENYATPKSYDQLLVDQCVVLRLTSRDERRVIYDPSNSPAWQYDESPLLSKWEQLCSVVSPDAWPKEDWPTRDAAELHSGRLSTEKGWCGQACVALLLTHEGVASAFSRMCEQLPSREVALSELCSAAARIGVPLCVVDASQELCETLDQPYIVHVKAVDASVADHLRVVFPGVRSILWDSLSRQMVYRPSSDAKTIIITQASMHKLAVAAEEYVGARTRAAVYCICSGAIATFGIWLCRVRRRALARVGTP
ncbi:MAG: hypothetical protein IT456_09970 [Planctomycetes bacterium]|nr:hypothetical protein [Planctomycetota bacterium]